jgi:nucleotide-binding universal stress UspA family protein
MVANAEDCTVNSDWKPKTILLATDFSRGSQQALAMARRLALHYGVGMRIVHVFTLVATHRYAVPVGWMIEDLRNRARKQLQQVSRRLKNAGCSVETRLVDTVSPPAAEILGSIAGCDDPLIVLGTHSHDRVERFFVGSTAEEVLRNTDWPVITVGPDVKSNSGLGPFNRLMLATDLTERSFAPIHLLSGLLEKNAQLTVVHVSSPDDEILSADWMKPLRSRIAKQVGKAAVRFEHYVAENCAQKISETAKSHGIDLLLIGLHPGRQFSVHVSPKTGFQIIMSAPCPVLSVRS